MFSYFLHYMYFYEPRDIRPLCRAKLVISVTRFAVLTHTLLKDNSGMFVTETLAALAVCNLYAAIWLGAALWTTPLEPFSKNLCSTRIENLISGLVFVYTVPVVLVKIFATSQFGPDGYLPYISNTGYERNMMSPTQNFAWKTNGACLLNLILVPYEIYMGTARTFSKLVLLIMLFFMPVFWTGSRDLSGFANTRLYSMQLVLHALGTGIIWKVMSDNVGRYKGEKKVPKKIPG